MDTDEKKRRSAEPRFDPAPDIWAERFNEMAAREEQATLDNMAFEEMAGETLSDVGQGQYADQEISEDDASEGRKRKAARVVNDNADEDPSRSRNAVDNRERNTGWNDRVSEREPALSGNFSLGDKLKGTFKIRGPGISVTGVVVGGGLTASVVLSPSLILVHVKEIFHNDRADATRTNQIYARAFLNYKFSKTGDKCGQGKSKIMCKLGTINKHQLKEYRDAGFKLTGAEVDKDGNKTGKDAADADTDDTKTADKDKRYQLETMEFADGHTSSSGTDAIKYGDSKPNMLQRMVNAFNPKSKFYQNKKFSKMLTGVLKIKKGKAATTYSEGEDDDTRRQRDEQFNNSTGGTSEAEAGNEARRLGGQAGDDAEQRATEGGENEGHKRPKTGGFSSLLRAVCTGYKTIKIGGATVQYYHYLKLANFAMEFLKVADMIKAGAAVAVAVSYISEKLTYTGPYEDKDKDGLSATDAQGYKMAAHGDMTGLAGFAQRYVLGGTDSEGKAVTALLASQALISGLEVGAQAIVNTTPGIDGVKGRDAIKTACRAISGKAALIAQCFAVAAQLSGALSVAPGFGTIAGLAFGAEMCRCTLSPSILKNVINPGSCDNIEKAIATLTTLLAGAVGGLVAKAAEKIIENWNIGSDTKGVDAGNALAAGAGLILSTAATSYALKPGTKASYKSYVSYTDEVNNKYENLARINAKETPFDIENKYSFISVLGNSIKSDDFSKSPLVQSFGNLFSVIPSAVTALSTKAHGLYSAPIEKPDERYDCNTPDETKNEDLEYLGVDGDKFCSIIPYTPTTELKAATSQAMNENDATFTDVIEYMTKKQEKPEGEAITSVASRTCDETCQKTGVSLASSDPNNLAQLAASADGGTKDDSQGCDDECQKDSMEPSVDPDTGKANAKGQYAKFEKWCTDQRVAQKAPWGASTLAFDAGSNRDQDWSSGRQCLKETKMLTYFRMWHNICAQGGTADGTSSCFEDDTSQPTSTDCGDGSTESIYDCALQFDPYGYVMGGGHGPSAEEFMKDFDSGKWTAGKDHILDCSGLVRMAIYEAMGVDIGGVSVDGSGGFSSPHLEKISASEAKKGDLVAGPGHIEIIGGAGTGNNFPSFGAHTDGIEFDQQISAANYEGTQFYRFKK